MGNLTNAIQRATKSPAINAKETKAAASVAEMVSAIVDQQGYRKRFDELLDRRAPQFIASIISLVNASPELQKVFRDAPVTIIQAALKAASFDLPIDPSLGYAYIVPFNNYDKATGTKRSEAAFVLGYKGMHQLALRTGVYSKINVIDVREGELRHYDRLTEDIEIEFVEDELEREKLPIIGWCGYYKLINGTEKTVYMSRSQIEAHERKNRKGQYMTKGWRENFEDMAMKTVYRRLIGKWGIMSIDYQKHADPATLAAAQAIATDSFDDEDTLAAAIPVNSAPVDSDTEDEFRQGANEGDTNV